MSITTITATVWLTPNTSVEHKFPATFEVCWRCNGTGSHVNPSIDGNGISGEEFDEDPDFRDSYMAGEYDVRCATCKGERVIAVIDRGAAQRTAPDLLRAYDDQAIEKARADQEEAWLRRAESGERW